jgi:hypothetical protein
MVTTIDISLRLKELDDTLRSVSTSFTRSFDSLYEFLGQCHLLALDIGSDSQRIAKLEDALSQSDQLTARQVKLARSIASKVALHVFRSEDKDFINPSTRSNYTRAINKAAELGLSVEQFVSQLKQSGLVGFLSDKQTESSSDSSVEEARKELMTKVENSVKPMGLIGNRNPKNTFAVVLYRADSGKLIPCFASDDERAVDAVLVKVARLEQERVEKEAEEVAAKARQEYLTKRKAA